MNLIQEKVLFHLTGRTALDADTEKQLADLCQSAPYFVPGNFLLAANQMNTGSLTRIEAGKRLLPHFTDTRWLSYQLDFLHELILPASETPEEPAEALSEESSESLPVTETATAINGIQEALQESPATNKEEDTPEINDFAAAAEGAEQITVIARDLQEPAPEEAVVQSEPADAEPEEVDTMLPEAATEDRLSSILSSQLADFKKPVTDESLLDLPSEPKKLHTIDYFASQGIRVDLVNAPQDKLTSKLLKFTDWLKQIKQAQSQPQDLGTHPEMEKVAAENARQSNTPREIVTEAMADVLVKQGQSEKAIQLYIKLSFLFPEKSSYFAAKIEQLKGI